jgi:hypothetical protein
MYCQIKGCLERYNRRELTSKHKELVVPGSPTKISD